MPDGGGRHVAVIPAYQAEATIAEVVERSRAVTGEVLVVDDGSTDGTAVEARRAGARVLQHRENLGKGYALDTAFREVVRMGADGAVTIDADGQHLPEEVPHLLAVEDADIVLGVRDHHFDEMGALRRASNRISSSMISWGAGVHVPDAQTGFRLYRRPTLDPPLLRPGRFESESAVIVRAGRRGLRVVCVPVEMAVVDGRGTSHFRPLVDACRIFRACVRARWFDRSPGADPDLSRSTR